MTTLHLGVIDIPYAEAPKSKRSRKPGTQTTGDVAEILEARYHPMEVYYQEHVEEIVGFVEDGLEGMIENMLTGRAPLSADPFGSATSKIEDGFKQFLATKEIEGLGIPGVPTQAAQDGVNHRLKHPYRKRAARPSFIDTGLYQASTKAWVD